MCIKSKISKTDGLLVINIEIRSSEFVLAIFKQSFVKQTFKICRKAKLSYFHIAILHLHFIYILSCNLMQTEISFQNKDCNIPKIKATCIRYKIVNLKNKCISIDV